MQIKLIFQHASKVDLHLYACIDVLSSSYTVNAHIDTHNQIWRDIYLFKYMIHVKTYSYANTS